LGEREFVTGNDLPRIVAHRCIIEASIGKRIVQAIEASIEQHRGNGWVGGGGRISVKEMESLLGQQIFCFCHQIEFVTSNDKPRIVAYRYIIEASIDVT
jgi:hypothetical protein